MRATFSELWKLDKLQTAKAAFKVTHDQSLILAPLSRHV